MTGIEAIAKRATEATKLADRKDKASPEMFRSVLALRTDIELLLRVAKAAQAVMSKADSYVLSPAPEWVRLRAALAALAEEPE